MPSARELQDGASGNFVEPGGTGWGGIFRPSRCISSCFVLSAGLRLRLVCSSSGSLRFWLDAQLRSCFRPATAGSSDQRSETGRSVDAGPPRAEPADSSAGA
jgi:hypothetical protein